MHDVIVFIDIEHVVTLAMDEILCLGCGKDIGGQSSNRRSLNSSSRVQDVWKRLFQKKLEEKSIDLGLGDVLLSEVGLMCRSCFSIFERFSKLQQSIETNLNAFTDKLSTKDIVYTRRKVSRTIC